MSSTAPHKHTNRLAREKSPYLLQHAHNPVNWFAWSEEAFARAQRENKPVFLSIGYSTCHWCHVMERESFEDEKVGAYLNDHFVSIKVDREERPDVDKIYMTFVQATTGSGGWPMSVFLTPDRKPFFGGTYFPPENRYGRPSFLQLLEHIHQLWETRRADLIESAGDAQSKLEQMVSEGRVPQDPNSENVGLAELISPDVLGEAGMQLKRMYDPRHGGFGNAPKFPQPSHPQFLLRFAKRFDDAEAIRMVLHTCERMAAGGIHDLLGGGFARYAVDAEWLVPHFEKMLYDNAQLAQLYLDAFLVSGEPRLADTARDILDYVLRDMTHPDGGFYSAEDADSEGHEGKFYCWTRAELAKLLAPEEFNVTCRYFGITDAGNFVDHSHPHPLPNQNVLSIVEPNVSADDKVLLASAMKKMSDARQKRVRPHRDDKVLASWNGLMLGAFARAYAVLGDEKYLTAAEKNLKFIQEKLWVDATSSSAASVSSATEAQSLPPEPERLLSPTLSSIPNGGEGGRRPGEEVLGDHRGEAQKPSFGKSGTLYHRWRDGERDNVELLEGYANMLSGVIELYEATLTPAHLDFALALADAMLAKFYDAENGGFWQSPAHAKDLILRVKEDYDGAEPSGNSVAILALLKLGAIAGRPDFTAAAEKSLRLFAARLERVPQAMPYMLSSLDFALQPPQRAVVAGAPDAAKFRELLHAVHSVYQPNKVVLGNVGPVEEFARTLPAKDGALIYLCTGNACQPPTSEAAEVRRLLQAS